MLSDLSIRNLGTFRKASVTFGAGLNVITGETGTGKTMLLRALTLILGGKGQPSWISAGCSEAFVDAVLYPPAEVIQGLCETSDAIDSADDVADGLLLGRVLGSRNRSSVNARPVPITIQQALGEQLIAIHGQHEQRTLMRPSKQRLIVDGFAGDAHLNDVQELLRGHQDIRRLTASLAEFAASETQHQQRREDAIALCEAFDRLAPSDDELDRLNQEISLLSDTDAVMQVLGGALQHLERDEPTLGAVHSTKLVARELRRLADARPSLAHLSATAESVALDLAELAIQIRHLAQTLQADPQALESLQQRRSELVRLLRITGLSTEVQLREHVEEQRQVAAADSIAGQVAAIQVALADAQQHQQQLAQRVSATRQRSAARLATEVTERLDALGLPAAAFVIDVTACDMDAHGCDNIEFALHIGGVRVPLSSGVSGGEMSRIALAIESVVAAADPVPVVVFDEIDAGVGGQTAHAVGDALVEFARSHQVIVVTHLPQVAACADVHLRVESRDGQSHVVALDDQQRVAELARMLGNPDGGAAAFDLARELLDVAAVRRLNTNRA